MKTAGVSDSQFRLRQNDAIDIAMASITATGLALN